jgi:hypothetical protein
MKHSHQVARNTGTYQQGLNDEQKVIQFLVEKGYEIRNSTREENIQQDIDVYVNGVPVSIKCQHTASRTGNLCFELETIDREGIRKDSWFRTGKADSYIILVNDSVYRIEKNSLQEYIDSNGFDRFAGLTNSTQKLQKDIGHRHLDVRVGLLNAQKLWDAGLLITLGVTLGEIK